MKYITFFASPFVVILMFIGVVVFAAYITIKMLVTWAIRLFMFNFESPKVVTDTEAVEVFDIVTDRIRDIITKD